MSTVGISYFLSVSVRLDDTTEADLNEMRFNVTHPHIQLHLLCEI